MLSWTRKRKTRRLLSVQSRLASIAAMNPGATFAELTRWEEKRESRHGEVRVCVEDRLAYRRLFPTMVELCFELGIAVDAVCSILTNGAGAGERS